MPIAYESPKLKSWASDVDVNTLLQAEKCARLPFVYDHISLMPDAHVGMGATVGSVIPTEGHILPAAVGVDIGCVDADSEYLSPTGWHKISEYANDKVMTYDPATGRGHFARPSAYVVRPEEWFYRLRTKYGINQMLSPDHRVLCYRIKGRKRERVMTVMSASEFASEHARLKQGFKAQFVTTFSPEVETKLSLSDAEIRVQVMVNADAHIDCQKVNVALKKERKISRAYRLLEAAMIPFDVHVAGDVTRIRFKPPLLSRSYESFWAASASQLCIIADECQNWDGNRDSNCFYSRDKSSADFIQYAMTAGGYRAVMRSDKHCKDGEIDYRVFANPNIMVGMGGVPKSEIKTVPSTDGKSYCFRVPTGFWVMRRGGNVVMTGNCGMIATETNLVAGDLPDDLKPLMTLIGGGQDKAGWKIPPRIPAGVGQGHDKASNARFKMLDALGNPRTELTDKQRQTIPAQYGTLGSGNHFGEVCLDERGRVWTVLHSGSRGIGNQLANIHIKLAKAQHQALEDPDLSYFIQGTPEFQAYVADMLWAQDYALGNRTVMAKALNDSLFEVVPGCAAGKPMITDQINCHHNFTARESFEYPTGVFRDLWITRKGAIKAYTGDRGVIPGSMGTRSYIVSGKGNPDSWCSCSHGAGRRMSRSKARQNIDPATLREQMKGKTWNEDRAKSLVDEAPDAYKSIETVMADQADLVSIDHELSQVWNYKG